ncbi:mitochondrial inner membrane protease subunit 2 isoform X4 [Gallus gallus]|nr:mitochondrial inner membrane protease subunit 2 isoform X4 [Gallus gallus]XP_040549190.1 mitochondrial inner membrane protease subunit 2 isoform X4 [Gallus gallus]XP_046763146.1 mitochondrial inner membrane protease subunit 2 isoform X4 [Gallus gallus]XP_046763147.1 mitochondrial inner membrane protease subunit 2 isoform X4 [Gallus gallus]XP_046793809.1 mitochondrial inner membrane protease subunit 2 isoform X4 [Gallus gallus]|eukprot:XP_025003425.1 mitochondrial inner membrane protease subunit 2 isoform X4 [Gallus gallus]
MAQAQGFGRRYLKAFFKGFFVAVPVTVTFLDRVACVARVEGASMQPSLNPGGRQASDVVLLNHWSIRNYDVQRGDIVSLVSPRNPEQKIIKRVIALEGDIIKFLLDFYMLVLLISSGPRNAGRSYNQCCLQSANLSRESKSDLNI